ncbi:glycosyltransferase family 2 protein [Pyxidicoccus caerfyrddinensis]|uniref:glycosyltransferase family 2 protein n=1 Tax=Pyxidicoccus caerfyrddinensis TaxID=2709663 RepID=UPI0013D9F995|nr:glycosyltransferase [Pyxidicoccus caerfyrddinensis]
MSPIATVLVPTFDHGPLLRFSVESALRQTVRDLEIFIVGDGVPPSAREVIAELMERDPRIRFFDFPKGERNGEASRHVALQEARGEIVCYLSDDDLWLPEHVERMHRTLQRHNFANVIAMRVDLDGTVGSFHGDVGHPFFRERLRGKWNFMPLTTSAHRLDLYRKLPHGWRPAPPEMWSDLHMYQQFLAHPAVEPVTLFEPTVLVFPTPHRRAWTMAERIREMETWTRQLATEEGRLELRGRFLQSVLRERAHYEAAMESGLATLRADVERTTAERDARTREREGLTQERAALARERDALAGERDALARERDALLVQCQTLGTERAHLAARLQDTGARLAASEDTLAHVRAHLSLILNSATWRARERLAAHPLLRQPLTLVARALGTRRRP